MVKQTTQDKESSNIIWNNLEEMVRLKVRDFIQTLLEAEIEELLGRQKSERRQMPIVQQLTGMVMGKSGS